MTADQPCVAAGTHLRGTGHSETDCPVHDDLNCALVPTADSDPGLLRREAER